MGADTVDIGKTIHPHPTLSESVGMGAGAVRGRVHRPAAAKEEMTQDELKQAVAREAIKYVVEDAVVGVGSGSTVFKFIDFLAKIKNRIDGAVAASEASAERLKKHGIRVVDLNSVNELPVYVDGADEITEHLHMIKGGGGALTREKIVAAVARKFVCICDASKLVPVLGKFPLPVEVIPMARSHVGRELVGAAAQPGAARELQHRQRQPDSRRATASRILDPPATGGRAQQHRRRGHQRPVRPPRRRRAAAGTRPASGRSGQIARPRRRVTFQSHQAAEGRELCAEHTSKQFDAELETVRSTRAADGRAGRGADHARGGGADHRRDEPASTA